MLKKSAFVLLFWAVFSAAVAAQTNKTRPRIVQPNSPVADSKITASDSSAPGARPKTLPVLRSGASGAPVSPAPSPTPPIAPKSEETVESDDEVVKVETELVTIPVTVFDRDGRFITDLQQKDFQVLENGKPQEIAYLQKTEQPFTVVLLLDVSPSTQFKIDEIQDAAIAFVGQLKPNDRVMVIAFNEQIEVLSEPTSDRNRLARAIRLANFGGGTSLYDAVDFAVGERLSRIEGRKAVVLFTDGVDTTSRRSDYNRSLRAVEEFDAAIFPIYYNTYTQQNDTGGGQSYPQRRRRSGGGLGGIIADILGGGIQIGGGAGGGNNRGGAGTSRREYEIGRRYVDELAARTGGRLFAADSIDNLDAAFLNIAEELRRQYSLGYYPAETGANGERKTVKVRVNRPNTIVRHRDSYTVGAQQQKAQKFTE